MATTATAKTRTTTSMRPARFVMKREPWQAALDPAGLAETLRKTGQVRTAGVYLEGS